jgi:hypothetical protein
MTNYLVLSYDQQQSYVHLHAFTKNLDDAKTQFDHLIKDLLIDDKNDEYTFVEMFKVNQDFVNNKGFLLFFGPEYSAIGKEYKFDTIERMYQWNNGLTTLKSKTQI